MLQLIDCEAVHLLLQFRQHRLNHVRHPGLALSVDYSPQVIPAHAGFSLGALLGLCVVVGVPALAVWCRRRAPAISFAAGLAVLSYLPTANLFFASGVALAERNLYLAVALPATLVVDAPRTLAVMLLPYDLREMTMLGDSGSNALGGLLGLKSVERFTGRGRWVAIGALAGLTFLGERTSLGTWIEGTPGVSWVDRLGRT